MASGLRALKSRLGEVQEYLNLVLEGRLPVNHDIMYHLQVSYSSVQLPSFDTCSLCLSLLYAILLWKLLRNSSLLALTQHMCQHLSAQQASCACHLTVQLFGCLAFASNEGSQVMQVHSHTSVFLLFLWVCIHSAYTELMLLSDATGCVQSSAKLECGRAAEIFCYQVQRHDASCVLGLHDSQVSLAIHC